MELCLANYRLHSCTNEAVSREILRQLLVWCVPIKWATLSWFGELIVEIHDIQFYGAACQLDAMSAAGTGASRVLGGVDRATSGSGRGRLRCSGEEKR